MVLSWVFTIIIGSAFICSVAFGNVSALSSAAISGAQNGITVVLAMAGAICLWSGIGKAMQQLGLSAALSKVLSPITHRLFPSAKRDTTLSAHISSNICANLLGLGNAATPMGIAATQRFAHINQSDIASHEMCRFIVLNTASIQLIPSTVAAIRSSLGCATPYDILPAVWITSLCSASVGLICCRIMEKL